MQNLKFEIKGLKIQNLTKKELKLPRVTLASKKELSTAETSKVGANKKMKMQQYSRLSVNI